MESDANTSKQLSLPNGTGYVFFNVAEVVRFEAGHNCAFIYFIGQDEYQRVLPKICEIAAILAEYKCIYQTNRSHIINQMHVVEFRKKERIIVTRKGDVPIAEERVREYEDRFCR